MDPRTTIRRTTPDDADRLAELAGALTLDPARPDAARGFLVSQFDATDYRRLAVEADHAFVLEANGAIRAFVIAHGDERIGSDESVGREIRRRVATSFVLIKQVCVEPSSTGRGYAAALYDTVARAAGGLPRFAAVVLEPRNDASVRFHERLGFGPLFEVQAPDGMRRGIWGTTGLSDDVTGSA